MEKIKDFTSKLDGNAQIINVLSRDVEILNKVSRFQIAADQLNALQKKMVDLNSLLSNDTTTTRNVKLKRRKELEGRILQISRIIQAFAFDKKKKKLQRRLDCFTPEYLQNCPDIELIKISKEIWLLANKYAKYSHTFISKIESRLSPDNSKATLKVEKEYGLRTHMIKNLEDENIGFIESMLIHRNEMKERDKVVKKIKKVYKQSENLLANKIDRFAFLFESENPAFYNEYYQLRENQLHKKQKENIDQEADAQNLSVENQAEHKSRSKSQQKPNPENKVEV